MDTTSTQVGGTHYAALPYQPIELIARLDLDFFQGNVVKYLSRYEYKGGIEDLKKAADYCQKAHDLLNYKTVSDGQYTRVTNGVEAYCKINGLPTAIEDALRLALLFDWMAAKQTIEAFVVSERRAALNAKSGELDLQEV